MRDREQEGAMTARHRSEDRRAKIKESTERLVAGLRNMGSLFATNNERGACVVEPSLASSMCVGLVANVGVVQAITNEELKILDEQVAMLRHEVQDLRNQLQKCYRDENETLTGDKRCDDILRSAIDQGAAPEEVNDGQAGEEEQAEEGEPDIPF
jgi:hypothetical protein